MWAGALTRVDHDLHQVSKLQRAEEGDEAGMRPSAQSDAEVGVARDQLATRIGRLHQFAARLVAQRVGGRSGVRRFASAMPIFSGAETE